MLYFAPPDLSPDFRLVFIASHTPGRHPTGTDGLPATLDRDIGPGGPLEPTLAAVRMQHHGIGGRQPILQLVGAMMDLVQTASCHKQFVHKLRPTTSMYCQVYAISCMMYGLGARPGWPTGLCATRKSMSGCVQPGFTCEVEARGRGMEGRQKYATGI